MKKKRARSREKGEDFAERAVVFLNSLGHSLAEETRQQRGVLGDSGERLAVSVTKQKPSLLSSFTATVQ